MTFDSDGLADLALTLRARMNAAGLKVAPAPPSSTRPPDVIFVHPTASVEAFLETLDMMSPTVVFMLAESFDPDEIDTEDTGLRAAADQHAGETFRLSVLWARDGMLHTWFITTDWHDALSDESEMQQYQAEGLQQMDRELMRERSRNAHRQLMELVVESPDFRGATINRRTVQLRLMMDANPALVDDLIFPREFVTAARRTAADEVARWEARLADDEDVISRLAFELRGVRTQREQKECAARMLRELADGWALTETFVDQMRRKARDADT
ncbi:hypothetical protein [Microbacterium sp. NPDC079995]|uniref:hypothetical protein n=1 Tax=unclassified Microbacterium TaxID=2609290 RepID=UPI00344F0B55